MAKVYTLSEVEVHNNGNDCWIIIDGKVYDVTKFLYEHPGGDDILISATGKDATDDFEDVGHSNMAREMMAEYLVGEIDPSTIPTKATYVNPATQPQYNHDKSGEFIIKILQFVVLLAILAQLAFLLRKKNQSPSCKSFRATGLRRSCTDSLYSLVWRMSIQTLIPTCA